MSRLRHGLTPTMLAELHRYTRDGAPLVVTARRWRTARALVERGLLSAREVEIVEMRHVWGDGRTDVVCFDPPHVERECWLTTAGIARRNEMH